MRGYVLFFCFIVLSASFSYAASYDWVRPNQGNVSIYNGGGGSGSASGDAINNNLNNTRIVTQDDGTINLSSLGLTTQFWDGGNWDFNGQPFLEVGGITSAEFTSNLVWGYLFIHDFNIQCIVRPCIIDGAEGVSLQKNSVEFFNSTPTGAEVKGSQSALSLDLNNLADGDSCYRFMDLYTVAGGVCRDDTSGSLEFMTGSFTTTSEGAGTAAWYTNYWKFNEAVAYKWTQLTTVSPKVNSISSANLTGVTPVDDFTNEDSDGQDLYVACTNGQVIQNNTNINNHYDNISCVDGDLFHYRLRDAVWYLVGDKSGVEGVVPFANSTLYLGTDNNGNTSQIWFKDDSLNQSINFTMQNVAHDNITMISDNGSLFNCGVENTGIFACS